MELNFTSPMKLAAQPIACHWFLLVPPRPPENIKKPLMNMKQQSQTYFKKENW